MAPSRREGLMPETVQVPVEAEDMVLSRGEKCTSCCKKFSAFLFSTIGLTCLMVGYTIFGGFIFMKLEAPNEELVKSNIKLKRNWYVQRLWNVTYDMNVFYEENWTVVADNLFEKYTQEVYMATKHQGWDGKDEESELQWTFAGALLYSITVITTIGYGHIAPKTMWGRIVTIFYAMLGIPLTLLTLTNLGGFMATAFRFLYHNICCGLFCICCRTDKATVNSSTVKYKDAKNGDPGASESLTTAKRSGGGTSPSAVGRKPSRKNMEVTWRSGLRRVMKTADNKTVTVPIYVSLLLICGYILSGAFLFTMWEKDWNYLIGSYFCFITLTTIGFGDFVPGTSVESSSQQKLVLCAMYLIFGLALIAMCFDLMQEEARSKFRALGRKIGILTKKSQGEGNENNGNKKGDMARNNTPSPAPLVYSPSSSDDKILNESDGDCYLQEPPKIITYPRYKPVIKNSGSPSERQRNLANANKTLPKSGVYKKGQKGTNSKVSKANKKDKKDKKGGKKEEAWEPLSDVEQLDVSDQRARDPGPPLNSDRHQGQGDCPPGLYPNGGENTSQAPPYIPEAGGSPGLDPNWSEYPPQDQPYLPQIGYPTDLDPNGGENTSQAPPYLPHIGFPTDLDPNEGENTSQAPPYLPHIGLPTDLDPNGSENTSQAPPYLPQMGYPTDFDPNGGGNTSHAPPFIPPATSCIEVETPVWTPQIVPPPPPQTSPSKQPPQKKRSKGWSMGKSKKSNKSKKKDPT